MNGNIRIARLLGIPIVVNVSWIATLLFVTSVLALQVYPEIIPPESPHRDDHVLLWAMAIASGAAFFVSIVLHELAHSVIAKRQGIPVKNITLFIFGGVSQIGGESSRPLSEFVMAIVGPLTSLLLSGVFFLLWFLTGQSDDAPFGVVLEWLAMMNLILAIFNMAPAFPMDGGRVLRSVLWALGGNQTRATRLATICGRAIGYLMMFVGFLAFLGVLKDVFDVWSGVWLALLGLFLESSARQSWFQARAMDILGHYHAEDVMNAETPTVEKDVSLRQLATLGGRRFIFFVADEDEKVLGIVTEKEVESRHNDVPHLTAGEVMVSASQVPIAAPKDSGDSMLQRMELGSVWHLPVISEGRLVGVVSKENLLRLLARGLLPTPPPPRPAT